MITSGNVADEAKARLMSVLEAPRTTEELVELNRSRHGYSYLLFEGRLLRGRCAREPDEEWCRRIRAWKPNQAGPIPYDVWVTLLTDPQAEQEMWPEFYTWADQWL